MSDAKYAAALVAGIENWIIGQADEISRTFALSEFFHDLAQVGRLRAFQSVASYKPDRGTTFLGYASKSIRGYILQHALNNRTQVRVPIGRTRAFALSWSSFDAGEFMAEDVRAVGDRSAMPEVVNRDLAAFVAAEMEKLDARSCSILKLRFFEELTLEEIASAYGITRERVRQIEFEALKTLRKRFATLQP